MNEIVEKRMFNAIFTPTYHNANNPITNTNFTNVMNDIIVYVENIDMDSNNNFIPCGRKLYITRPKMRVLLRRWIQSWLPYFFEEIGYKTYKHRYDTNIEFEDTIEKIVKILARKQQGK